MKISRSKFVAIFLVSALVFQFATNTALGTETRLFPLNGDVYPGAGSSVGWKSTTATIIYPIKVVLLGPLSFLFKMEDPAPPILLLAFAAYWVAIALVLHFILSKIFVRKKV